MNFFNQVSYSITKPSIYKQMAERGIGRSLLYIWLLTTILFIIWLPVKWAEFNQTVLDFSEEIKENVPEFSITNGQLSIDVEQPYYIAKEDGQIFVIDTTGKFKPEELDKYEQGILVTKEKIYHNQISQTRVYKLADFNGLNKENLIKYLPYLKSFGILGFIFIYIGLLILKLIIALFLSLIGLLVSSTSKKLIPFGQIYSMALYSWTLPMMLDTAFNIIGIDFPGNGLLRLLIGTLLLILAINKSPTQNLLSNNIDSTEVK